MKSFLICLALLTVAPWAQSSWDLNDVSYLMPLPTKIGNDFLLRFDSLGLGGALSKSINLARLPALTMHMTEKEVLSALRVVSVRIDPCFPLPTPMDCQKQVRLIWQPIEKDRHLEIQTVDASLHSFYKLSDEQFQKLTNALSDWKAKYQIQTKGLPLQLHPAWAQDRQESPALKEFNSILLSVLGPENFMRVTVMVLRGAGNMWAFASFEPVGAQLEAQPIARLKGKKSQTFINLAMPTDHFEGGGMFPKPEGEDTINTLFEEPSRVPPVNEELIIKEFKALYRIENPKNFHAENMDCVSCHVTQPVKHLFLAQRPGLKLDLIWDSVEYKNDRYNLENKTDNLHDTQILRAFGYFGRQVVISQRVIHESAEVADQLNQSFPERELPIEKPH